MSGPVDCGARWPLDDSALLTEDTREVAIDDSCLAGDERSNVFHQASGMVAEQAVCTIDAAVILMVARAQATDRTLDALANAIVERDTDFTRPD